MGSCDGVTYEDLRRRQALPLEVKVELTRARVREWHGRWGGKVYLSFSGGKDSTVLLDIVKGTCPDVPAVFCDTGLEYPEVREFALARADAVIRPEMTFKAVLERYGYPVPTKEQALYVRQARHSTDHMRSLRLGSGRYSVSKRWRRLVEAPFEVSEKCCEVMKKRPFRAYSRETGRKGMTAMMACESSLRERRYLRYGCSPSSGADPMSMPMAVWTEQDVLAYIAGRGLDYAACYGLIEEGPDGALRCTREDRTGCMFCMFGAHLEARPNRFERMERDYPRQYAYCMGELGLAGVLDYCGIPRGGWDGGGAAGKGEGR